MTPEAQQFPVRKVTPTDVVDMGDMLAVEEPLEIRLVYGHEKPRLEKTVSITMRTPGHDDELALGFLFTEGIIRNANDVLRIPTRSDGNSIAIELETGVLPQLASLDRHFYTTSSCGVCGKASLEAVKTKSPFPLSAHSIIIPSGILNTLQEKLKVHQKVFAATGGLHASALFDNAGELLLVKEDVGRHNALDKVIGACLHKNQLPLHESILLLSGRISFELVQKAYMAGIPFIAAIGAPSTLAVTMAQENDITLVGFLRENRYTIYSGKQRIG